MRFGGEAVIGDCVLTIQELKEIEERFKRSELNWTAYLFGLSRLPEIILWSYQFVPKTEDEHKEVKKLRLNYITLAHWMGWLIPGDKALPPELFFTDKVKFKPLAQLSKAFLDLAVELYPRSAELQESFPSPISILFAWEYQSLENSILDSGFLGGKATYFTKSRWAEDMRDIVYWLENVENWKLQPKISGHFQDRKMSLEAGEGLLLLAALEARQDSSFRRCDAYRNFQSKLTSWKVAVRTNPELTASRFSDGKLLPSGRNAERKPRHTSKGFVTK